MKYRLLVVALASTLLFACDPSGGGSQGSSSSDVTGLISRAESALIVQLPASLETAGDAAIAFRPVSRAVVDLKDVDLPAPTGTAHSNLTWHVGNLETRVEGIITELAALKIEFAGSDLAAGEYVGETFENGDTLYLGYEVQTVSEEKWYLITNARFDAAGSLEVATYLDITENIDDAVNAQCMYTGSGSEGRWYNKVLFDTRGTEMEEYYSFGSTDPATAEEVGHIRFSPEDNSDTHAVRVAMRWEGTAFGVQSQVAWADDNGGAVMEYHDPDESTENDERVGEERFVLETDGAVTISRLSAVKTPNYEFERVYWGREAMADPNDAFWGGAYNAYSSTYAETGAPALIWLVFDVSAGDATVFDVYVEDPDTTTTPLASDVAVSEAGNPEALGSLYWLEGSGTDLLSGDAVYYMRDHQNDDNVVTAEYYKASEVPQTDNYFGEEGFFSRTSYPIAFFSGQLPATTSIIKVDEGAITFDDGSEDRYFIDVDESGSFGTWTQIEDGRLPDVELMTAQPATESYFDITTESTVSVEGTHWLIGEVPEVDLPGDAQIVYDYESEDNAISAAFDDTARANYLADAAPPEFPVSGDPWRVINESDFD